MLLLEESKQPSLRVASIYISYSTVLSTPRHCLADKSIRFNSNIIWNIFLMDYWKLNYVVLEASSSNFKNGDVTKSLSCFVFTTWDKLSNELSKLLYGSLELRAW